jgi:hypothetical protein
MRSGQGRELGMAGRRATLVAILGVILVACSAEAQPTPSERASPDRSQGSASPAAVVTPSPTVAPDPTGTPEAVVVEPTAEPATPSKSPSATRTPKPTRAPTQAPGPPKPTGIILEGPCALDCRPSDPTGWRINWKAPRSKGVEIRVYGVTTCFRTDRPRGKCLRRDTRLSNDTRVLLAKGPAAKGSLRLPLIGGVGTIQLDGWCADVTSAADDGPAFFSIVLAAYDQNGHSPFAIADPGKYYAGECEMDIY